MIECDVHIWVCRESQGHIPGFKRMSFPRVPVAGDFIAFDETEEGMGVYRVVLINGDQTPVVIVKDKCESQDDMKDAILFYIRIGFDFGDYAGKHIVR
jgi:hypothetical protein